MARPRRFDEQALLDTAQELFWVHGYARTSIDDIATASGVGNGSIYAAYTSKLGLFVAVFERYCDARVRVVERIVDAHHGTFEDAVENYLSDIVRDCTGHADRRGCLMLNTIAELGSQHPEVVRISTEAITRMEDVLARRVAESVASGEIALAPDRIRPLGAHLVLVSQGIISMSRTGMSDARLQQIAATTRELSAGLRAA